MTLMDREIIKRRKICFRGLGVWQADCDGLSGRGRFGSVFAICRKAILQTVLSHPKESYFGSSLAGASRERGTGKKILRYR